MLKKMLNVVFVYSFSQTSESIRLSKMSWLSVVSSSFYVYIAVTEVAEFLSYIDSM